MRTFAYTFAMLLTVAGTASATPLSPPVPGTRFDVSYDSGRFAWHVGEPVVVAPAIRFGSGRYDWSVVAGALPPGLVLGPMGAVYGAPRTPGRYAWTVLVRDVESGANSTATASADVE